MKKKLLFIMSNLQNGGAERSLVNLLQLMDYDKYEVDLLLFQEKGMFLGQVDERVNILHDGYDKLHRLYSDSSDKYKDVGMFAYRVLATTYSKFREGGTAKHKQYRWNKFYSRILPVCTKEYDVGIAYLQGEQYYYLVDKVRAKKKIGWIHNEYPKTGLSETYDLPYIEKIDHIVTISDACAEVLKQCFPSQSKKVSVLPNLVSEKVIADLADKFYPEEFDPNAKILVSIGRLHPQKGFDLAIEAAQILKAKEVRFNWYILGSGVLESELKEMVKKLCLEDVMHFIGSRENPYPYIKNSDVIIQSSRFEGKSIVLDEAKILSKPIVATNYTTIRDQLKNEEGVICEMTPLDLAEKIMFMLENGAGYSQYLSTNNYGNADEIEGYYEIFG